MRQNKTKFVEIRAEWKKPDTFKNDSEEKSSDKSFNFEEAEKNLLWSTMFDDNTDDDVRRRRRRRQRRFMATIIRYYSKNKLNPLKRLLSAEER